MNPTALIYALLTIVLWGVGGILDKWLTGRLDPLSIVIVRSVFVVLVILSYGGVLRQLPRWGEIAGPLYGVLFVQAALIALSMVCYFRALKHAEASLIIPLTSAYPLVTLVLAVLFLHEPLTVRKIAGVALILCGMVFLVEQRDHSPVGIREMQEGEGKAHEVHTG